MKHLLAVVLFAFAANAAAAPAPVAKPDLSGLFDSSKERAEYNRRMAKLEAKKAKAEAQLMKNGTAQDIELMALNDRVAALEAAQ